MALRLSETVGTALVDDNAEIVAQLEHTSPELPAGPAVQQLSADGAMVPCVHGDWTEAKLLALDTVDERTEMHATELSYFAHFREAATLGV
jgi:hypothetical protein